MAEKLKPEGEKKELAKIKEAEKRASVAHFNIPDKGEAKKGDWKPYVSKGQDAFESALDRELAPMTDKAFSKKETEIKVKKKRRVGDKKAALDQLSVEKEIKQTDAMEAIMSAKAEFNEPATEADVLEPAQEPALAQEELLPKPEKIISAKPEISVAEEPKPKEEFERIIPAGERTATGVKEEEVEKEEKISPEDEKIGGREFNLKNRYVDLYKDLKKGLEAPKEVYNVIYEDQNKLAELYGPKVRKDTNLLFKKLKELPKKGEPKEKLDFDSRQLKKLYFELFKSKKNEIEPPQEILDGVKSYEDKIYERELRKEVGPIFDKIKMEAMEETGYKPTEKKEKSTIMPRIKAAAISKEEEAKRQEQELTKKRWQLAEKYDLKNVEEIKKFIEDHTKK
jgi:hypothetical protein